MTEWIWIDGQIMPLAEARIGVEDRAFQFADSVYEVIRLYNAKPFTLDQHLHRLCQSAKGINLEMPMEAAPLAAQIRKLIAHSGVREGMIYLQLSRGAAPRNHVWSDARPSLLFYARELPPVAQVGAGEGVKLLAVPDERWKRCWIKSTALLANVLAKNQAVAAGADEAVFIENDRVTECSASNLFAVIGRRLLTHPVGTKVLPGITRAILLELAPSLDIVVDERALGQEEACRADELFITSTTREISWVARWNDRYIGQGRCGPLTIKLHTALREKIVRETA